MVTKKSERMGKPKRKKTKRAMPALPEKYLPQFELVRVPSRTKGDMFIFKASFGDVISFGEGCRKKLAKRAAADNAVRLGIARLQYKRVFKSSSKAIPARSPSTHIIEKGSDVVIDLTMDSPNQTVDDSKQIIEIKEDYTIVIKDDEISDDKYSILKPASKGSEQKTMVRKENFNDLTSDFPRPADGVYKDVDDTDKNVIDLTSDVDTKTIDLTIDAKDDDFMKKRMGHTRMMVNDRKAF